MRNNKRVKFSDVEDTVAEFLKHAPNRPGGVK